MTDPESDRTDLALPREPIHRIVEPLERFLHVEAASGIALVVATAVALALANSPWADGFLAIWKTELSIGLGALEMSHSLKHWINDGLMAIFFFVIGLEVKRELVLGELRDLRAAVLPIAAAVGGMVVPAGLYLLLAGDGPAARGWGIPMATDIAFVVGCLAVLGPRVPKALRVMLLSLAIADDIGAILVIAIGYTESLNLGALGIGVGGIVATSVFARVGVRSLIVYWLLGGLTWVAFHESGVHATIAGVVLGLMTPARRYAPTGVIASGLERAREVLAGGDWDAVQHRAERVQALRWVARESVAPLEYLETVLHPWVAFGIMPLFALANAGVPIGIDALTSPVALAVGCGLVIVKPLGIFGASWLATKAGIVRLPESVSWRAIAGGGFLCGIGFTMALFIAGLALAPPVLDAAKVGVLVSSVAAAAIGMLLLSRSPER